MINFINRKDAIESMGKAQWAINRISELSTTQPVDEAYLIDWYISSVDNSEPIWTEAHIEELMNDFYLIPKEMD